MDAQKKDTEFLSFLCPVCRQEIEAPCAMANQKVECPACAAQLIVPSVSTEENSGETKEDSENGPSKEQLEAMKSRTLRIELGGW